MNEKMLEYCRLRASGVEGSAAVRSAGYSANNVGIRAAQLDARKDVQEMIAKLQRNEETCTPERSSALKARYKNPLELLLDLMNNPAAPDALRYQAAKDALPYTHGKIGEGGKKEKEKENAEKAAGGGRFAPRRGPGRPRTVN